MLAPPAPPAASFARGIAATSFSRPAGLTNRTTCFRAVAAFAPYGRRVPPTLRSLSAPLRASVCPALFSASATRVLRNPRDAPAAGGSHVRTSGRSLPTLRLHAPPFVRSAAPAAPAATRRPTGVAFRLRFGRFPLPYVLPCAPPFFPLPLLGCCATLATLQRRAGHTFALRVARSLRFGSTRRPSCSSPLLFALSPPRFVCTCAAGVSGRGFAAPRSPRAARPRARGIAATAPPRLPCGRPRPRLCRDLRCPPQRPKGRLT